MKLLFLLVITALIGGITYLVSSAILQNKKSKKFNWKPLGIASGVVVFLLALIGCGMYASTQQADMQCSSVHTTQTKQPASLTTATDYFQQGNYEYDTGNCQEAIGAYTKALALNPQFAQAYNNRAYTYMRLRDFSKALPDLDMALKINPKYIQALMNRGDIHNYYYQIDRQAAIDDYKQVIALTPVSNRESTNVCGHLFLAKHNGWTLGAFIDFFRGKFRECN